MAVITIIGAGMMGSALAFPARENGNTVRLVGTPLDRDIIDACKYASVVSILTRSKFGCLDHIPSSEEIEEFTAE